MTKNITTMEDRVLRIKEILGETVRYTEEKENLTKDCADVFNVFIPGDEHRLLTPPDWRHSPALEPKIIEWLAEGLGREEEFQPTRRKVLSDGGKAVWVHVRHMLDDYWTVDVFNIVFHEEGEELLEFPEGDAGWNPFIAVARIMGSSNRILRNSPESARLT